MAYFNKSGKGGGGRGFERRDFGKRSFDDRGSGRPPMHKAVCSECGNSCEVPFKPTGDRPVYCSNCFKKDGESGSWKPSGRDSRGGGFDRDSRGGGFDRGSRGSDFGREPRFTMHEAVCDDCGNTCEVPFKPNGDKPVYCSNCFKKGGNAGSNAAPRNNEQAKEQYEILNIKLDRILKILTSQSGKPEQDKPAQDKSAQDKPKQPEVAKSKAEKKPAVSTGLKADKKEKTTKPKKEVKKSKKA